MPRFQVLTFPMLALGLVGALLADAALADDLLPLGDDFQANSYTTGFQESSAVAVAPGGDFVLVWESEQPGGAYSEIVARHFEADGSPGAAELQVNTYTRGYQLEADVAAGSGQFFVVWKTTHDGDNSGDSIRGRLLDGAGMPVADPFQVNGVTLDNQEDPRVAALAGGDFVVVYRSSTSLGDDNDSTSVQAGRFDSSGSAVAQDFQVNFTTAGSQSDPDVAATTDGGFAVVWQSPDDMADDGLMLRRYDSQGVPGPEQRVTDIGADEANQATVIEASSGQFVVAWRQIDGDGAGDDAIWARRLTSDGGALGAPFQVNAWTTGDQREPQLLARPGGGFLVAWQSQGASSPDGSEDAIQGRLFDGNGQPIGEETTLNSTTFERQVQPALGSSDGSSDGSADGDRFVVAFTSDTSTGTDPSGSIQARRFFIGIFADDFESGDLSAWSVTSP